MKKISIISRILSVVCCIMMATSVCNAQNLTGSGTESDPYLISTQSDLETFANNVNSGISYDGKFIKLTDNIECDYNEDIQWTPIGNDINPYKGTFDGNGKTISGLYFDNSDQDGVGLFGNNQGTIKNVGVVDPYFKGNQVVGGVCGYNNGTITNCYNTGEVSGITEVGGVCGYNDGTITNCYNTGKVSGNFDVGGVYGGIYFGTITNCYYLSDADNGNDAKTKEQFNNGCVAYLLSQGNNGGVWGQDLSKDNSLPMLNGSKVYKNICEDVLLGYSNEDKSYEKHEYENGICKHCGLYQPAVNNTDGYYEIANAGNLYWFANFVNQGNFTANAILTDDIVVNTLEFADGEIVTDGKDYRVWSPIGYGSSYYQGTFNGNGHTISGLYFNKSNQYNVGLFGQITGNAVIKNVGVIDSYFKGEVGVGGVCGDNDSSKGLIENCYNASIVIGNGYVGGVCGDNSGTITNCYNAGGIKGRYSYSYTGGVCGFSEKTIINCYNIGDIEGYYDTGGVCGGSNESLIKNCYNIGEVNGDEKTGGVCGYNYYGTIQYCHNVGMVNSEHYYIGGVCGYNSYGAIQHCYFNSDIYQGDASYGDDTDETVAGKSSADFKNLVLGLLNVNGNNVWGQGLSYPMLISNHVHEYSNGFCMVCNVCQQPEQDADGVYEIANAGNLYWFAQYVNQCVENLNANAILVNNIEVNTEVLVDGKLNSNETFREWTPIGISYDNSYKGTFDGNGKTISGLYFDNSEQDCVGLFGNNEGTIKNVGVVESYFKGNQVVGGVCGLNEGTITNCYNTGEVSGSDGVGGVCGYNDEGTIKNCYNTGEVSGGNSVGGVCGYVGNYCTITNCYNMGAVTCGGSFVGGISGNNNGSITNCYNTGEVNGGDNAGGVCGNNGWGTITNCYYLGTSANTGIGKGDGEATAKTATQFADGTVAKLLFASNTIWGQNTSTDTVPNFSGKILFKVTLTAENGTAENGLGEYNKKYEIKATANTGYHFVGWSNGSTEIKDSILVECDTALVATFEAHSFGNWDTTLVATCTTSGLRTHACACGEVETDTIAKLAHTVVVDSAKTATCTVAGLTEGSRCSVCGEVIKAQQTIPMLEHSFTNYIYNNDATTEADGTETAVCDHGCGATDTRTAEGTKLTDIAGETANAVAIYAHHNVIVVENADADIYVYDATGRCIEMRESCPSVEIALPREGIYIVRTGDKVQRVAVVQN